VTGSQTASRIEELKSIIRELHDGKSPEEQKERFARLLAQVSPSEIAEMEQSLIADGMPEDEVKRLCDVHVAVFADSLDKQDKPLVSPGHPVHTFQKENSAIGELADKARFILGDIESPPDEKHSGPGETISRGYSKRSLPSRSIMSGRRTSFSLFWRITAFLVRRR